MNRKKVKIYIDKINALHSNILSDEDFSEMEIDLLKNYTMQLYEALIEGSVQTDTNPIAAKSESSNNSEHTTPKVTMPDMSPAEVVAPASTLEDAKPVLQEPVAEILETVVEQIDEEPVDEVLPSVKPELEALFEIKAAKELSDKLSMLPIKDIASAMSINEKIFTAQELFGGDDKRMQSTIEKLDEMKDYNEAKQFLIHGIADEFEWYTEAKEKKASHFIQLIKRRFN